jgi:hypothetical protein
VVSGKAFAGQSQGRGGTVRTVRVRRAVALADRVPLVTTGVPVAVVVRVYRGQLFAVQAFAVVAVAACLLAV